MCVCARVSREIFLSLTLPIAESKSNDLKKEKDEKEREIRDHEKQRSDSIKNKSNELHDQAEEAKASLKEKQQAELANIGNNTDAQINELAHESTAVKTTEVDAAGKDLVAQAQAKADAALSHA